MIIHDNLFNPITWFESKESWESNKATYKGKSSPTIVPRNYLPSIQVTMDEDMNRLLRDTSSNTQVEVRVISHDDKKAYYLKAEELFTSVELLPEDIQTQSMHSYVYMGGRYILSHDIPVGTYYLMLIVNNRKEMIFKTWYSDLFTFRNDTDELMYIKYRNEEPIITGGNYMPFSENDKPRYMEMWIDAEMMNNEFMFEDTSSKMSGYDRIEKRISYKLYNTTFLATESVAESLRLLWHCGDVEMTQRGRTRKIGSVSMEVDWGLDNHFANVRMKFKTDTIIQTNGNGRVYVGGKHIAGDFDDKDYNPDYDV
jgi:hypothetical protein